MRSKNRWVIPIVIVLVATAAAVAGNLLMKPGDEVSQAEAGFYYTCPMHPSVVEEGPGDCPICGMTLVRKEREAVSSGMDMDQDAGHTHEAPAGEQEATAATVYTCPMHPSVVSDKPGDCPICGMSLVPRREEPMEMDASTVEGLVDVTISPRQRVLANVATSPVEVRGLNKEIVTVGRFGVDEQRTAHVAAWVGGRIERLHVDFTGAVVRKGQPLLEIYSPALVQTQEEYLSALPPADGDRTGSDTLQRARERLLEGARQRLALWGITDEQIAELERTRQVRTTMTITAPASGTVLKKLVQEGQYVQQGQSLLDIADLSRIWLYADIYEYEIPFLRVGQEVLIYPDSRPGEVREGKVTFIDPVVDPRTRTVAVRAEFDNRSGDLRPSMIAQAVIHVTMRSVTVVEASAVIDTGRRQVVWQEVEPNRFSPRQVTLGARIGDYFQVLDGLEAGAMVATSGGFLLDSESQLKAMAGGGSMPGMDMGTGGSGSGNGPQNDDGGIEKDD